MKAQLANEFYTWFFVFVVMAANAGASGLCLFSKKALASRGLQTWRKWLWVSFLFSMIAALALFFPMVKAHSAWISFVPYWQR